jgi:hypothetical protein
VSTNSRQREDVAVTVTTEPPVFVLNESDCFVLNESDAQQMSPPSRYQSSKVRTAKVCL